MQQLTQTQQPQTRPDDTDSFTPRVRSDKRSITLLLGKYLYFIVFIGNWIKISRFS